MHHGNWPEACLKGRHANGLTISAHHFSAAGPLTGLAGNPAIKEDITHMWFKNLRIFRLSPTWSCTVDTLEAALERSEERRVGKESGRTCRTRWSPCHKK